MASNILQHTNGQTECPHSDPNSNSNPNPSHLRAQNAVQFPWWPYSIFQGICPNRPRKDMSHHRCYLSRHATPENRECWAVALEGSAGQLHLKGVQSKGSYFPSIMPSVTLHVIPVQHAITWVCHSDNWSHRQHISNTRKNIAHL